MKWDNAVVFKVTQWQIWKCVNLAVKFCLFQSRLYSLCFTKHNLTVYLLTYILLLVLDKDEDSEISASIQSFLIGELKRKNIATREAASTVGNKIGQMKEEITKIQAAVA